MLIYVVQRGDILWQIANRYRVSVSQIVKINQLPNPNQLVVGQSLVIPTVNITHTVKSGEALWMIAQRYGMTVNEIVKANNIADLSQIYPGMVIKIPGEYHTVQSGDTLWKIAARYGTKINAIMSANQLENPNNLSVGMVLRIPIAKPVIETNAFTYQSGTGVENELDEAGPHLTYLAPFAYVMQSDGSLQLYMQNDTDAITNAVAYGAIPMMSITNFTSTSAGINMAHAILSSSENRQTLLNNILSMMRLRGYKGLNIDFENVLPDDRELYNQFLREATTALHQEGYFISTSLAPKISATQQGLLYEAHDYPAHGDIVDFVVLMTYEWGYRKGPPRAISPLNEIKRVLDYAVTVIPREKILMGFQLYARDWLIPHIQGQEAHTISPQDAVALAAKYDAAIEFDPVAASPYFHYTDEQGQQHEVWFEDARSAQAKFDLVKNYKLRGVSYWVLGYAFPQNWALLEDNFMIKKM